MSAVWPHGHAFWTNNVWPEGVEHFYEVTLQPMHPTEDPHLVLIVGGRNVSHAIQIAENRHPGHIARNVEDVS